MTELAIHFGKLIKDCNVGYFLLNYLIKVYDIIILAN